MYYENKIEILNSEIIKEKKTIPKLQIDLDLSGYYKVLYGENSIEFRTYIKPYFNYKKRKVIILK